jgi:ABC-type Fe3+ transport system substrate-binding protein
MRRYLPIALFLAVLLMPVVLRRLLVHGQAASDQTLRLVIITPNNQDIRREFAVAFDRWHREHYGQGVTIDYRTPGGTPDIKRQLTSIYDAYRDQNHNLPANVPADIDVVWGGGDFFFDQQLKPLGILQPMRIEPALLAAAFPSPTLAGVRLLEKTVGPSGEPTPRWVGICLSSFGIVYNPDVYNALKLPPPRQWHDLADPRLAGFVALADPAHSASVGVALMMVLQRSMADAEEALFAREPRLATMPAAQRNALPEYQAVLAAGWKRGMADLTLIAANARYFTDSAEMVPNDVSRGEAAAGVAIDFYARSTEQVVGEQREQFVLPLHATAITPDPVAILVGVRGERLELAQHFVEFLLSEEGQRLWALPAGVPGGPGERALFRTPIRRDVYDDQRGWESVGDPFVEAGGFNERNDWMALYSDTVPIWDAAWIDSRDALIDAYRAVLAVRDPARRELLLAKLADLPVEMSDVAAIRDQRTQMSPDQLDQWKVLTQITWAKKFRAHYQAVESEAR